jgi:hypothetical protein
MTLPPVYTEMLFRDSGLSGASEDLIPPAGLVWIVTDISAYANPGSLSLESISMWVEDTFTAGTWAYHQWIPLAGGGGADQYHWSGRQAFAQPGGFRVRSDANVDVRITGYVLSDT